MHTFRSSWASQNTQHAWSAGYGARLVFPSRPLGRQSREVPVLVQARQVVPPRTPASRRDGVTCLCVDALGHGFYGLVGTKEGVEGTVEGVVFARPVLFPGISSEPGSLAVPARAGKCFKLALPTRRARLTLSAVQTESNGVYVLRAGRHAGSIAVDGAQQGQLVGLRH